MGGGIWIRISDCFILQERSLLNQSITNKAKIKELMKNKSTWNHTYFKAHYWHVRRTKSKIKKNGKSLANKRWIKTAFAGLSTSLQPSQVLKRDVLSPITLTWNQNIPPPQSVGWVIEHVLGPNKGNVIIAGDYFHQRIRLIIFTVMASVELLSAFH